MDRNREARRTTTTSMAAAPNGLSRRRHRSSSLRDSPDEDGPVELQEPARLRDRGGLKKDRDRDRDRERDRERDRDRDRDRDRTSRSKRRRENRMMGNREDGGGDDTSEESVNDEDDDDEDDGSLRMLPPQPSSNPAAAAVASMSNHNNLNYHNHHHHPHNRKSFPPAAAKVFRPAPAAAAPPAGWKAADEMIGVSVPRKARSASTKRSHDWISGAAGGVSGSGVGGTDQNHRQSSTSPVRLMSAASPAAAPVSPSSSNASVRKKMKPNGGIKPRPPKSSSKSSSSNPEELEIEIAEVLYGLMTQSQGPSKKETESNKFDSNKSSSDNKSRVSSPISNSTPPLPQNSSSSAVPSSAVAPKRKRPRQVSEAMGNFSVRSSPGSSMKNEIDHQSPKTEGSSPNLDNNSGSAAENAVSFDFASSQKDTTRPPVLSMEEHGKCGDAVVLTSKEEVTSPKESYAVRLDGNLESKISTAPSSTATTKPVAVSEIESQKEEKFEIDLMAPPPQLRSSPERDGDIDHKLMASQIDTDMRQLVKGKEDDKLAKAYKEGAESLPDCCEEKASKGIVEQTEESKRLIPNEEQSIDLQLDLEKTEKDATSMLSSSTSNRSQNQIVRHQQQIPVSAKSTRDEINADKTGSLPLPMSVASWPNGVPQMGYVAPLQGVVSMDGNTISSTPIQPIFTQPRPKRCATHCYIARNILYLQQFMRMSPFWPAAAAAAGSAPMFGAKPCNLNVMPAAELHGSIAGRSLNSVQEKGQGTAIFPGHTGKDKSSQAANSSDPAQRKQPILLQQALPSVAPNNILHGPAFIFPINQQPVAAASVRPGSSKSTAATGGLAASTAANSATASASATPAAAMSFNYPNMTPNETQYLAILQNNPYPFSIPAVGAPPNYRGSPHAQAMPLFNGSFYSSQMIHPSHLQQQPPPLTSQSQQISQVHQISSGSSQKHLQIQQQRQQGTAVNGGSGSGNLHNYPAPKARSTQQSQQQHNQHINPPQARHLESEVAGEDGPSTADSRVSRAPTMSVYGHNFGMPIHPQNFAVMNPPVLSNNASGSSNEKKQQQQPQQQSQQQGLKRGVESFPPQTFAMSFSPMNGTSTTSIDLSTMAQNHAILSSLQDSRQSYHQIVAAAAAHQAQQKKNLRVSEESKTGGAGPDSSNADEERKVGGLAGKGGVQSIAFSRPDLADASGSSTVIPGNSVIDSSSRNLNLASGSTGTARTSRTSPMSNSVGASNSHLQAQLHQQQQIMQLQKHQQQNQQNQQLAASLAARSKNPPSSNGSVYPEHLITSSSSVTSKFPNSLSSYPQSLAQTTNSSSPTQSPQWKNSARGNSSPVPSSLASSTTSSLKSHPIQQQQQTGRTHQQSHTQISFGGNQKSSTSHAVQQQQGPTGNSSSQCASPPMVVGSPTTSSISKGASGSPRTNASVSTSNKTTGQASSLSSHQSKSSTAAAPSQRSSQSILGNPHITSSSASATTKSQQQQQQQQQHMSKQSMQQAQLYFSNPYMQVQHSGNSAASSAATSGYYIQNLQRRRPEQQNPQQQSPSLATSSSTGMLSLCPPVTLANATTSDPTKAIAAAVKGSGLTTQPGILHAQFTAAGQSSGNMHQLMSFPYVHPVPAAVQVKTAEQKQPAGNDNLHACWQPEKK